MDIEKIFRSKFNIKEEQDIVALIEAAVDVAAWVVPDKLKKYRSRIVKLLFAEDPAHSTDLFSDDELGLDDEDDGSDLSTELVPPISKNVIKINLKGFKKSVQPIPKNVNKINSKGFEKSVQPIIKNINKINPKGFEKSVQPIPKNVNKINPKGFEKSVQPIQKNVNKINPNGFKKSVPPIQKNVCCAVKVNKVIPKGLKESEKDANRLKFEATQRKLGQFYEVEKKAKRKIECIDLPEPFARGAIKASASTKRRRH